MTTALDFSKSFAGWKAKSNWTRINVEAKCDLVDAAGTVDPYVLVASCKAEHTYADGGLLQVPNYDFCAIFGRDEFLIIRTRMTHEDERTAMQREYGLIKDRFDEDNLHLATHDDATVLTDGAAIVKATLANRPIVVTTELSDEATRQRAVIEYPVKTMNILPEQNRWQVDTGPVLLPDFSRREGRPIERFDLAFSVFNRLDQVEFIVRRPTAVGPGGRGACRVHHYAEPRVMAANNTVLCAGPL